MGQALSRAERAQPAAAASLFAGWQEKLIASALEGAMGGVWMLEDTPGGALAECGDFLFLEARDSQTARNLLMAWKREHAGRYAILVARDSALSALVPEVFAGDAALTRRYAFHKGGEAFDRERLARFAACAPAEVELRPFDREACRLAMQAPWSRSFCEQFRDEDDFLARGLGVAALRDGELVGGASSYVCFSGGIEMQVETRKDMRRRGVALACCARLILTCLDRGLYPSWDAANLESVALARRLGYRPAGPYDGWELYRSPHTQKDGEGLFPPEKPNNP